MAALKIEMKLNNAAFDNEGLAIEVARALRHLADRIEEQTRAYLAGNGARMRIADINGNTIGFAEFDIEETEEE